MAMFKRSAPPEEADNPVDEDDETTDDGDEGTTSAAARDAPEEDEDVVEDDGDQDADEGDDEGDDDEDEEASADDDGDEDDEDAPRKPARAILPFGLVASLATRVVRISKWRGWTPVLLFLIFFLAIFLRAYFYAPEACPSYLPVTTPTSNCLYSGNDPDYHKRAIDHLDITKQWLVWDPLQNYPQGGPNPNPPGFETSGLLFGYLMLPIFGNGDAAVTWGAEVSGAFWAALIVFPVYFVGREMFGRRAGLIGAFFIAIMAGNIERNVLGFSDHDGYLMFFIATGFYFFIKAMAHTKNRTYVTSYSDLTSVTSGLIRFSREQRVAVLYTLMASTMWGACALGWKGFPYVFAIVVVYYFITVVALRWFRREDPFAVGVLVMISFAWVMVMTLPYYYGMHFMHWYEIFYLLWAAAALITVFFIPTRNIPWVLLLVSMALLIGGFYVGLKLFAPDIAETVFSGAGYFSRNKLYGTIAEAQPPDVSRLLSSYGYWTAILALGGIGLMAARLPRKWSNAYVLMLAWAATAIYMALTAVRFMFNATPLFAILAGWITWGIIDRTHFSLKTYRERWAKYRSWRKLRTIPLPHWAVAYFVAFMILWPNIMQGVDAAVPFESKKEWDTAIYNFMPDLQDPFTVGGFGILNSLHVFRPAPDVFNSSSRGLWYLGSFGTSFMNDYWAVAMKWLATQDTDVPEAQRPGFISWWDYGHWAMHVGEHPTAADNFQNGFEFAGNFIGASGEDEGNSLILARYLETVRDNPKIVELAKKYLGQDGWEEFERYAANPTAYNDTILANPGIYKNRDAPISERNAFYILVSTEISQRVTPEDRIWWIRDIKQETGFELRYFAVDVRMMPFSASNTGIFYAPIILADFDKDSFVEIQCVLSNGRTINCDDMTPREYRLLTQTKIVYKENFYQSMFLRAYLGYSPKDITQGSYNGLPGIRASCDQTQQQTCLANSPPMQGYNMSHWRLVQRTVYFNPNATDLANHSSEWKIITDQEADNYEGNNNVTVDRQFLGLGEQSGTGVTYLKYYAGAWVNGTVRTADGTPVPGARVTVYDDVKLASPAWPGVPHGYTFADENGSFSALVPFGNVTLLATTGGGADSFQLREQIEIGRTVVPVSDDQAMRLDQDFNQDGVMDYNIARDIVGVPGSVSGRVYLDRDGSASYGVANDEEMAGAILEFNGTWANVTRRIAAGADGSYSLVGVVPGLYDVNITYGGHRWVGQAGLRINSNQTTNQDLVVSGASVTGTASDVLGAPRANATVTLKDAQTGALQQNLTSDTGAYGFRNLLPGNYTVKSALINATPFEVDLTLAAGEAKVYNFTASDTVGVNVRAYLDADGSGNFTAGEEAAGAQLEVGAQGGGYFNLTTLDANGTGSVRYPAGNYTVRADYFAPTGEVWSALADLQAAEGANWSLRLGHAARLKGSVFRDDDGDGLRSNNTTAEPSFGSANIELTSGALTWHLQTRADGIYEAVLPAGTFELRVVHESSGFTKAQVAFLTVQVNATTTTLDIPLVNGTRMLGSAGFDADASGGTLSGTEMLAGMNITLTSGTHRSTATTDAAGQFQPWLTDGNWTVVTSLPGYAPNSTVKFLNGSDPGNNSIDLKVTALPRILSGRVGFDLNGDGNISASEGFAGVTLNFTAETALGPFYGGANATATTNATGDYAVAVTPGHYVFNFTTDQGTGAQAHRYQAYNTTNQDTILHPLVLPSGDPFVMNLSLRELTQLRGIVCYDSDNDGVCPAAQRPSGVLITISNGPGPTSLTSAANGSFEAYLRSGLYRLEATTDIPGVGPVQAILDINVTAPLNLGLLKLERRLPVTVHAFRDANGNGVQDAEENLTGPTVTLTNVTSASAVFDNNGNASVQLLAGRTYAYRINERRSESLGGSNVSVDVQYKSEGNFTFTGTNPVLTLPVVRLVQVSGAFYYDRNADGTYTPGNSEEPVGAFIEMRDAANTSRIVDRSPAPAVGSWEVFVPKGNYVITVDHAGFNGTDPNWTVNITDSPPEGGYKVALKLVAHDVQMSGYTFLDLNLNGRLNAFESGMQVPTLRLFNATNLTDARSLTVAPDGRFNAVLTPGTYTLYAAGSVNGSAVAGIAQAIVDPVGGIAWVNVSLRHAYYASGISFFNNTTGTIAPVPAINWTVTSGAAKVLLLQPAGGYNVTLPEGAYTLNATLGTNEFGTSMNYTGAVSFSLDLVNITNDLNLTKVRRYAVTFNYTEEKDPVAQGESKNYTVLITNSGTDNATFDLAAQLSSIPPGWSYNISRDNVTLEIGEQASFFVLVNSSNQTRSGHNILQVRATPHNITGEGGSVDLGITTLQVYSIAVRPDAQAPADLGGSTNYYVSIENKGNGVDKVAVTVAAIPEGYNATVDRGAPGNEAELQPFSTSRITVTLTRQAFASPAPAGTTFRVDVRSVSDANGTTLGNTVMTIAYADLAVGDAANATRANEPTKGDLVDHAPLTTPGFEGALAAAAVLGVALAARRRKGEQS